MYLGKPISEGIPIIMGMFDNIAFNCLCPTCNHEVYGFQSKDGDCMLHTLAPSKVHNFYTYCNICNTWIEFDKNKEGTFDMIKPNLYSVKDIITKEDAYNNIYHEDWFITTYCTFKLFPLKKVQETVMSKN